MKLFVTSVAACLSSRMTAQPLRVGDERLLASLLKGYCKALPHSPYSIEGHVFAHCRRV